MKEKVRDIPVHDFLLPTVDNLPFDVREFTTEYRYITQADLPHRHYAYHFIYITGAEGTHYIDFEAYPLQPDSLYFISPGQIHFLKSQTPIKGYFIIFTNDFLTFSPDNQSPIYEISFFNRVRDYPVFKLAKDQTPRVNAIIQILYDAYHSEERDRVLLLRAYLRILIIQAQRLYDTSPAKGESNRESSLVRRFMQLVSENFLREQSVQAYANRLGISVNHLSDTIKALTGCSPGSMIRQQIVLEAKRLLALTDLTVAEIGYAMNFGDPSYFGRFLRRETGLSPRELRRHIREKYLLFRE